MLKGISVIIVSFSFFLGLTDLAKAAEITTTLSYNFYIAVPGDTTVTSPGFHPGFSHLTSSGRQKMINQIEDRMVPAVLSHCEEQGMEMVSFSIIADWGATIYRTHFFGTSFTYGLFEVNWRVTCEAPEVQWPDLDIDIPEFPGGIYY